MVVSDASTEQPVALSAPDKSLPVQAAALREVVTGLTSTLADTRDQLRVNNRMLTRQRLTIQILIGLFLLMAIGGAYFGITTHTVVSKVRETQLTNRATSVQIADCLTPGRPCYERSQENQRKAITAIVDTNHNGKADTQEILDAINKGVLAPAGSGD